MRLRPIPAVERPPGSESVLFEVQIPSIFQYAWAVVTREFVYKSDEVDWKRERLVAQLKAAVEQIETIISSFSSTAAGVVPSGHMESDLKYECMTAFKDLYDRGLITPEIKPQNWSRFADNVYKLVRSYGGNRVEPAMKELIEEVVADLSAPDAARPRSGTLFQMIVGKVAAGGGTAARRHLNNFRVLDSQELRELYNVSAIPKDIPFDFNLVT